MKNKDAIKRLKKCAYLRGRNAEWIAYRAGLEIQEVKAYLSFDKDCSFDNFIRMCNALDIDVLRTIGERDYEYETFCYRVKEYVFKSLEDSGFTVADIVKECNVSRKELYNTLNCEGEVYSLAVIKYVWKVTDVYKTALNAVYERLPVMFDYMCEGKGYVVFNDYLGRGRR